ncbi:MAG: hypothetical protein RR140_03370 [Clostridia bacterium]
MNKNFELKQQKPEFYYPAEAYYTCDENSVNNESQNIPPKTFEQPQVPQKKNENNSMMSAIMQMLPAMSGGGNNISQIMSLIKGENMGGANGKDLGGIMSALTSSMTQQKKQTAKKDYILVKDYHKNKNFSG